MSDVWRDSYDAWKLATPPEYDEGDFRLCDNCNCGLSVNDDGEWLCERCDIVPEEPEPPQHEAHVDAYYRQLF